MLVNRIVLDTNCLIAILSRKGNYFPVWQGLHQGKYVLRVSNEVAYCGVIKPDSELQKFKQAEHQFVTMKFPAEVPFIAYFGIGGTSYRNFSVNTSFSKSLNFVKKLHRNYI